MSEEKTVVDEVNEPDTEESTMMDEIETLAEEKAIENDGEEPEGNKESAPDEKSDGDKDAVEDDDSDSKEGEEEDNGSEDAPDEQLLERAVRAGITLSDARSISDQGTLTRLVERMEVNDDGEESGDDVDSSDDGDDKDQLSEIPDLDPEEYPEEVVGAFAAMKKVIGQQAEQIKGFSDNNSQNQAENDRFIEFIDSQVNSLGEDFEDVLGKGDFEAVKDNAEAVAARDKVVRHMNLIAQDYELSGKEISSRAELFKLAVDSAFAEKVNKMKGKAALKRSKNRSKRAHSQPRTDGGKFISNTESAGEDALSEAVAEIQSMMDEN